MSELTQVAVLPYRFSNATPGEFLRQSAIANNKLLESEGFDAEPLAFIASKTLKHFWVPIARGRMVQIFTPCGTISDDEVCIWFARTTRIGLCTSANSQLSICKRLKITELLAVEAVIGEPVSASYFPDSRENTG